MSYLDKRGRLNALRRYRPDDDPVVIEAARTLKAARAEEYITRLLAETPPLSAEDKLHLTRLLTSPTGGEAA